MNPVTEAGTQGAETWAPPAALTIERIKELRQELAAVIGRAEQVWVDLGAASELDLAGLQLLCSAHRTAASLGKALRLAGPLPPHLRHTLREAGFIRHVGCARDCTGSCLWGGHEPEEK